MHCWVTALCNNAVPAKYIIIYIMHAVCIKYIYYNFFLLNLRNLFSGILDKF